MAAVRNLYIKLPRCENIENCNLPKSERNKCVINRAFIYETAMGGVRCDQSRERTNEYLTTSDFDSSLVFLFERLY